ncbi:DUF3022 domain-containing protein [Paraburkholderia sp. SIMBA_049]
MKQIDLPQRIEEIGLGLAQLFESPKPASVTNYDEGSTFFFHVSWVVESHRDTSLDARCVVTIRFSDQQIRRYAAMETAKRRTFRDRLCASVRARFTEQQNPPTLQGDCAIEMNVEEALFDMPEPPYQAL